MINRRSDHPKLPGEWHRWDQSALTVFARVGTLRIPSPRDFNGRSLPPLPELTTILSALQAHYSLHAFDLGIDDPTRDAVLAMIADDLRGAVTSLRERGLDLVWRFEMRGGPSRGLSRRKVSIALGVTRS
jgi:hypothetical protein